MIMLLVLFIIHINIKMEIINQNQQIHQQTKNLSEFFADKLQYIFFEIIPMKIFIFQKKQID